MDISIPKIPSITIQGVTAPTQADITALRIPPAAISAGNVMLRGVINGRTPNGEAILRTMYGDLYLKTDLFLKSGSDVMLQLHQNANEMTAKLVTIDGKSLTKYLEILNAKSPTTEDIVTLSSMSNETEIAKKNALQIPPDNAQSSPSKNHLTGILKAILLTPTLTNPTDIFSTKTIETQLLAAPPTNEKTFNPQANTPLIAASSLPNPSTNSPTENIFPHVDLPLPTKETLDIINKLPTGAILDLKLLSINLPNHPLEKNALQNLVTQQNFTQQSQTSPNNTHLPTLNNNANQPHIITAQVISHPDAEDIILHTPVGTMRLLSPSPLPTGTIITMNIEHATVQTPINQPITTTQPDELSKIFHDQDILNLSYIPPQSLQNNLNNSLSIIPQLGKNFTTELLFFLAALKTGDINNWIGAQNAKNLKLENPILLEKLTQGLTTLHHHAENNPQNNAGINDGKIWQQYILPIFVQGEFSQVFLYHPKDKNDKNQSDKEQNSSEHFIVEVHLSQMGRLQLDGFVRNAQPKKVFELIIRSTNPLPPENQQDIRDIFQTAQELTGFVGGVSFQNGKQACRNFVDPPKPRENFIVA